jgi:hypothetical protein
VTTQRHRFRQAVGSAAGSIEMPHIPKRGIWTSVSLSRGQFFGILLFSVLLFLFLDGPVWRHLREPHTGRIAGSYGAIPVLVTVAQWKNHSLHLSHWLEASVLIAVVKLLITVVLLIGLALLV